MFIPFSYVVFDVLSNYCGASVCCLVWVCSLVFYIASRSEVCFGYQKNVYVEGLYEVLSLVHVGTTHWRSIRLS